MSAERWLLKAEAWAQSEQGAQLRLLGRLQAHERALATGDADEIVATLEAVEAELRTESSRARERRAWIESLARCWAVEPRTLTLRSIVERAGASGERLGRLRGELDRQAREVAAAGRRIAMIARTQRSLLGELLSTLTGADPESPDHARGTLVDARG
jgi:hypothetical protein